MSGGDDDDDEWYVEDGVGVGAELSCMEMLYPDCVLRYPCLIILYDQKVAVRDDCTSYNRYKSMLPSRKVSGLLEYYVISSQFVHFRTIPTGSKTRSVRFLLSSNRSS